MQRSGGGAVFGEINVNCRGPLIPVVRRLGQSHHFADVLPREDLP
jgi:hypothetical protein